MEQRSTLAQHNPARAFKMHRNGTSFTYHTSYDRGSTPPTSGPVFQSGLGRSGCSLTCRNLASPPDNCGHHPQWQLPAMFQVCGHKCKAGLCRCLEDYADNYKTTVFIKTITVDMTMATMDTTDDKPAIKMILLVQIIDQAPASWI